ncbi:MAG: penicillin-binding protein 2 [Epibacterium sp.]|nr:penicillin-binding protein 2 [Epibacterium sp.]NQX73126.1 penicillin-binding protein 2 [Epibacterium sp.]
MKRSPKELDATHRTLTRRTLFLGGLQLAFAGGLAARMRYLQVDQADEYRLLAEENRINFELLPPTRGRIFDRNGVTIAQNSPSYRIVIVPENTGDIEASIANLRAVITISDEDVEKALKDIKNSKRFHRVTLSDQVTWEDVARVAANAPALPGIAPEVGLTRVYPQKEDFAHVVGYVGPVSDYDLSKMDQPDPILLTPRFQFGKVGLESKREETLRGKAGTKQVEVNAFGRVMRELGRQEGEAGADLQLTLDAELQSYVQARLGEESAAVVVIDVENGDLRAIASAPSFDPNLFVRGISVGDYSALTSNAYRPLSNKTVQGTYPPGSTFKMVTALAGLHDGVVGFEDTTYCPGHMEVGGRRFHCWKQAGHGHMNLEDSLKHSCDVYYYDLAVKVGIDKISEMAKRLGLGIRHDLPMSAVAKGLAPNRAWKDKSYGQDWLIGDTVNASIGQGYMLASPLQLAVMSARLATGRSVTPRLIKSIDGIEEPSGAGEDMGLNPTHLRAVQKAMYSVSNDRRGTAYRSRIIADGMRMAGKTGTSQVRNITAAERAAGVVRNEDLPWERRDHALFVAFAPYDNPKYAVSVVVEHGGGGSKAAAPIGRDVMLQALYEGAPPLSAYPKSQRTAIQEQQERLETERLKRGAAEGSDQA